MILSEIAKKTGLTKRRLCYVLEHDFFGVGAEASRWEKDAGRGNTRSFDDYEAFGLSCVGLMLNAGLRRREITNTMARIRASSNNLKENLLFQAFTATRDAVLEIGDQYYYRFVSKGSLPRQKFDTKWRSIDRGDLRDQASAPFVVVRIDVAAIRDALNR